MHRETDELRKMTDRLLVAIDPNGEGVNATLALTALGVTLSVVIDQVGRADKKAQLIEVFTTKLKQTFGTMDDNAVVH